MTTPEQCEICSKLAIKRPDRRHSRLYGIFLLLTLNRFHTLLWYFSMSSLHLRPHGDDFTIFGSWKQD